jgi:branched-chain amino acid aminotransferase
MILAENELGLTVRERSIDRTELLISEEVFLSGTAVQITAVTKIDHIQVGNGEMGPIAARLRELFFGVARGRNPDYQDWVTPVYA